MELSSAIEDYRYLLNRGYKRESAVRFVGDKYLLGRGARLLLYRCVHNDGEAEARRKKIVPLLRARGRRVAVDGFNTLITVEQLLEGRPLILCDDGFIRDLSATHNKYKPSDVTREAIRHIATCLKEAEVGEAGFFFDSQMSRSGELAALVGRILAEAGVKCVASAVRQADLGVVGYAEIVASSDAVVIDRATHSVDLVQEILRRKRRDGLILNIKRRRDLERLKQLDVEALGSRENRNS